MDMGAQSLSDFCRTVKFDACATMLVEKRKSKRGIFFVILCTKVNKKERTKTIWLYPDKMRKATTRGYGLYVDVVTVWTLFDKNPFLSVG